ncbi:MAG: acyl carrier protein [Gammaproteobacteria bacterium]|nr:acyl carrier protein [Gammaproteobacteria bacterium]
MQDSKSFGQQPLHSINHCTETMHMADYDQYLDFMYGALGALNKEGVELSETTDLVADIGLSSLEVMEFIEMIEDEFDISIPLNILPDINTVGQLAQKLQDLND